MPHRIGWDRMGWDGNGLDMQEYKKYQDEYLKFLKNYSSINE